MSSYRSSVLKILPLVAVLFTMAGCGGADEELDVAQYEPDRAVEYPPEEASRTPTAAARVTPGKPTPPRTYLLEEFQRPRYWTRLKSTAALDAAGHLYVTDGITVFRIDPEGEVETYLELTHPEGAMRLEIEALDVLPSGKVFLRDDRGCFLVSDQPAALEVFFPRTTPEEPGLIEVEAPEPGVVTDLGRTLLDGAEAVALALASLPGLGAAPAWAQEEGPCRRAGRMAPSTMAALDDDTLLVVDRQGTWQVRTDRRELLFDCAKLGTGSCGSGHLAVNRKEGTFFYASSSTGADIVGGALEDRRVGLVADSLGLERQWSLGKFGAHPEGGILINMEKALVHLESSGTWRAVVTRPPLGLLAQREGLEFRGGPAVMAPDGTFYLVGNTHIYRGTPVETR